MIEIVYIHMNKNKSMTPMASNFDWDPFALSFWRDVDFVHHDAMAPIGLPHWPRCVVWYHPTVLESTFTCNHLTRHKRKRGT